MVAYRLPPLPTIKDILRMYNIRAQKRLSQNFLLDPRLLDRVARAGGPLAGKHVVEVGPGPGGITRAILGQEAARCAVVEKDPRFLPSLHLLAEASGGRMDVHLGDVLAFNMTRVFPDCLRNEWGDRPPEIRVLGNLPFNVATPLLIRWLSDMAVHRGIFSYGRVPLTLTFQQEVADRLVAPPGSHHRSRLSVMAQNWAMVRTNFTIPGAAFVPKPEVDVGVVTLTPLTTPYIDLPFGLVEKCVTTVFHGKKKSLSNTVANLFPRPLAKRLSARIFEEAGLPPGGGRLRPIDLDMAAMGRVCHSYHRICQDSPALLRYTHTQAKALALPPATYQDGQECAAELEDTRVGTFTPVV